MLATQVYAPIQKELSRVEDNLKSVASRKFPFLAELLGHVFETTGKRVRPAITLLASKLHPHDERKSETMATAVELLHIASLVHDDTVDSSALRRGKPTISSLWGRNAAVLVGDYIFASSATQVCDTGDIRVIRRFSETIMELASGELQETADAYDYNQTLDQYLERIYNKTASLFSTAGESGAVLSGAPEESVQALKQYSHNIGMAFQIIDDILDLQGAEEEAGKPVGNDLSQGVMTLPALMFRDKHPEDNPIRDLFRRPDDEACLKRCVEAIQGSSAVDESYSMAREFCRKGMTALQTQPPSIYRDSMEELVEHVLERSR